jgi:uncharacterized protein DUF4386
MTRMTNARLAGFTYLFYIAVAFPEMVLFDRAANVPATAAKLARIAEHAADVRIAILLSVLSCFAAVVLAVALYGITCDEDRDLALIALACRVGEGVTGAAGPLTMAALLWLATASGPNVPDTAGTNALAALLLKLRGWSPTIGATFFAVGSTIFSYLLLRGRMIPVWLAWVGVVGSALLVVGLPLQLAGFLRGPITQFMWLPVALFELTVAPWLLIRGVAASKTRSAQV